MATFPDFTSEGRSQMSLQSLFQAQAGIKVPNQMPLPALFQTHTEQNHKSSLV